MKKVFLSCFILSILSCQILSCQTSRTCDNLTQYLADKVASSYECSKPEVFYNYLQKICPSKTKDPGSIIGKLACRVSINYIADNINEFSQEADCKFNFISDSVKESLIESCSILIP